MLYHKPETTIACGMY